MIPLRSSGIKVSTPSSSITNKTVSAAFLAEFCTSYADKREKRKKQQNIPLSFLDRRWFMVVLRMNLTASSSSIARINAGRTVPICEFKPGPATSARAPNA